MDTQYNMIKLTTDIWLTHYRDRDNTRLRQQQFAYIISGHSMYVCSMNSMEVTFVFIFLSM